ncbi:MAG TPA: hypothetical protein VFS76_12430 [Pyrinomonadaceae bacterium]|nr:hypothetical protein [Pyrinomonadaceae bacterium]
MSTHGSSAPERKATPHATNSTTNQTISDAIKRRAQSLINDRNIDESDRAFIRYALATNDASGLSELVRRADAGEPFIDDSYLAEANDEISTEEKLERLAAMICQAGSQPETRSAALLVLMSTLETSTEPKLQANYVKHIAFTRCGELNCFGMVDTQIAAIESELLVN